MQEDKAKLNSAWWAGEKERHYFTHLSKNPQTPPQKPTQKTQTTKQMKSTPKKVLMQHETDSEDQLWQQCKAYALSSRQF